MRITRQSICRQRVRKYTVSRYRHGCDPPELGQCVFNYGYLEQDLSRRTTISSVSLVVVLFCANAIATHTTSERQATILQDVISTQVTFSDILPTIGSH